MLQDTSGETSAHGSMRKPVPKVLLVDDQKANLIATSAVLKGLACETVTAASGNDALRALLKEEFAVVLLDLHMPGMNGYEVAELARSDPRGRHVPIIFMTAAHETEEIAIHGYRSGAVDFLFKPVNPHIVRGKVQVFLELYQNKCALQREVAAHRRTAAELVEANQSLRHFAHLAAHDLQAPLRAARGFVRLCERSGVEGEPPPPLTRASRALDRMALLLESLLAHARLQRAPEWSQVDTGDIVLQVLSDLSDRIAEAGARVDVDELPTVRGDVARIYQLFLNLVANALKFRRAGVPPQIHVYYKPEEPGGRFSIRDNGIGIDPQFAEKIFEPFGRLHDQSEFEGTGLGLAICQKIVEQHGGRIWMASEPDRGSTFYFTISSSG